MVEDKKWFVLAVVAFFGMGGAAPQTAFAADTVTVYNGVELVDGTFLNAQNVANNLVFTSITLQADNEIKFPESINIGTSPFGTPAYDLSLIAPKVSILGDVTVSNLGNFFLSVSQIDLAASFYNVSGPLTQASRLFSTATSVNVLSNNASLQQALDFTNYGLIPSTVTAAFGTASSLAFNYHTSMVLSGGLLSGTVAMNNLAARLELDGHDFLLDTGSGFQAIGSGSIGASSGQLKGVLASGDPFAVNFTQGGPGQISVVASIPEPEAYALLIAGLGLMGFVARRRKKGRATA